MRANGAWSALLPPNPCVVRIAGCLLCGVAVSGT
jgi:hypothetical protein